MRTALLLLSVLVCATAASAQATRTWVSGLGDDINPCSRTSPCKTWAGGYTKTAAGGEVDALDPGGFGYVTLAKPLTLDGAGAFASILGPNVTGIKVAFKDPADAGKTVRLRRLSLNGLGTGVAGIVVESGSVLIEDCSITGFKDGVVVAAGARVFLRNVTISGNTGTGVSVAAGGAATLSRSTIIHNGTGLSAASGGRIASFKDNAVHDNGVDGEPTEAVSER